MCFAFGSCIKSDRVRHLIDGYASASDELKQWSLDSQWNRLWKSKDDERENKKNPLLRKESN